MSELTYLFQSFIEKGTLSGSRSTVLQPFYWIIAILTSGVFACLQAKAPEWVLILVVSGMSLSILGFLFAYFYCLVKDKDALRSEKYNVTKMAIEQGFKGDSLRGLVEVEKEAENQLIEVAQKVDSNE